MKRVVVAAILLLLGLGGLCAAWYASARRAIDAEVREREHRAARAAAERERTVADSLARKLDELRRNESRRPYFHYQNLIHDPKGASQGLSVVPSPLASGPGHPLVAAHFQIDAKQRVSLPTLNDDVSELNAPAFDDQTEIRAAIAGAAGELRDAARPILTDLERQIAQARETASRIAALEQRLAESEARRLEEVDTRKRQLAEAQQRLDRYQQSIGSQSQRLDPYVFAQNVNAETLYTELKAQRATAPPPAPREPVDIRVTDLQWSTIAIDGAPRLVALRGVRTPAGELTQGLLTSIGEGAVIDGATLRRGTGAAIEGTGWRAHVAPAAVARGDEVMRLNRTLFGVAALLLLVVAGVVWMISRAEALAAERARFAATAAHELRTPLAALRLYSDMIADERDPAKRERYAREISGQTERLGRLVANVLEVTRLERGTFALNPRPAEIGPAVEECVERLRPQMEAANCPIALSIAHDLPPVAFDPDALHHIVDNLVDNAEKYSRDVPQRDVAVAVAPADGGVSISVSDRGPGLPEDVFRDPRPFHRAASPSSPAGLGLGLFLVQRIVGGHGGAIETRARPGGGATVSIFLPAFYKP